MNPMKSDDKLELALRKMAEEHRAELPSPGLLWWRAQVVRKQREKERIERPLLVMKKLAAMVTGAVLVALGAENSAQLRSMMRDDSWFVAPTLVLTLSAVLFFGVFAVWTRRARSKQQH